MHSPSSDTPVVSASTLDGKRVWRTGTLTYTTGALVVLFLWLLWGDFAWAMRDRSVVGMASWYLSSLKIPNLLFGILMSSFPGAVSLILGPIISVKSDRHRSKWGRRIPFLMVTTPIAAFGMIGLAITPFISRWLHGLAQPGSIVGAKLQATLGGSVLGARVLSLLENEMVVAVVCFAIFWAAFEFATVAGQSVFGGLINDVVPQEMLGRFYALFRTVSLIDGMIFNFWIMGKVPNHFSLIMTVVGVFYGVAFMWVCFKVREGDYPPLPPSESEELGWAKGFMSGAKIYFRECFTHPYYIRIFLMLMAATLSFLPINTFALPYARSLAVNMETYGKYLALTYMISLGLAFPLGWLVDRIHPLRVTMGALVGYFLVTVWGMFYASSEKTFLIAWVLHGVFSGCYFTSAASIGQRLFPREKFAQFASAALLFAAPLQMSLAPLVGLVIDRTGNIYRYAFTAGSILVVIALIAAVSVYRRFLELGGPKNYVAPIQS